jgi:hypothetical protein
VRDLILGPLLEAFESGKINHEPVSEMRIQCGPTWDRVERAKLIAIVDDSEPDAVEGLDNQFLAWQELLRPTLGSLALLPTEIVLQRNVLHETIRNSNALNYDDLSD